jgi:hypothetical protein
MPRKPSNSASLAWFTSKATAGHKNTNVKLAQEKKRNMVRGLSIAVIATCSAYKAMNCCAKKKPVRLARAYSSSTRLGG